ncbi:hypothetical protein Ancab_017240, partial [Ancistrocladus abbreviatus]
EESTTSSEKGTPCCLLGETLAVDGTGGTSYNGKEYVSRSGEKKAEDSRYILLPRLGKSRCKVTAITPSRQLDSGEQKQHRESEANNDKVSEGHRGLKQVDKAKPSRASEDNYCGPNAGSA